MVPEVNPRGPQEAQGHHRQPELLDDHHGGAGLAAAQGQPDQADRRSAPTRRPAGAGYQAMLELEQQVARLRRRQAGHARRSSRTRSPSTSSATTARSPRTATTRRRSRWSRRRARCSTMPHLAIVPTCVRVPVLRAHTEAIKLELDKPMIAEEGPRDPRQGPGRQARRRSRRPTTSRCRWKPAAISTSTSAASARTSPTPTGWCCSWRRPAPEGSGLERGADRRGAGQAQGDGGRVDVAEEPEAPGRRTFRLISATPAGRSGDRQGRIDLPAAVRPLSWALPRRGAGCRRPPDGTAPCPLLLPSPTARAPRAACPCARPPSGGPPSVSGPCAAPDAPDPSEGRDRAPPAHAVGSRSSTGRRRPMPDQASNSRAPPARRRVTVPRSLPPKALSALRRPASRRAGRGGNCRKLRRRAHRTRATADRLECMPCERCAGASLAHRVGVLGSGKVGRAARPPAGWHRPRCYPIRSESEGSAGRPSPARCVSARRKVALSPPRGAGCRWRGRV